MHNTSTHIHASIRQTLGYTLKPEKLAFIMQALEQLEPMHTKGLQPRGQIMYGGTKTKGGLSYYRNYDERLIASSCKRNIQPM